MNIIEGSESHLEACFKISETLNLDEKSIPEVGALLDFEIFKDPSVLQERDLTVAMISDDVVGFLLSFGSGTKPFDEILALSENVAWNSPQDLKLNNYRYMYSLGIDPYFHRKGIGSALYRDHLSRHPNHIFIASLIECPFNNLASLKFHEQFGFKKVGTFEADEFDGIKGYKCGIYLKNG